MKTFPVSPPLILCLDIRYVECAAVPSSAGRPPPFLRDVQFAHRHRPSGRPSAPKPANSQTSQLPNQPSRILFFNLRCFGVSRNAPKRYCLGDLLVARLERC